MLLNDNGGDLVSEVLLEAESILRQAREQNTVGQDIENQGEITDDDCCLNCGRPIGHSVAKNLCIYCYEEWDE